VALWKIEGSVLAMSCSDDRRRVAVVVALQPSTPLNRPGRLLILDVGRNAAVAAIELAQARPVHPVFSGDGSQVAFGDGSKVRLWNLGWKGKALDVGEHDRDVTVLSISPDGARLVTAGVEGTVRIWDLPRRELLLTIRTMLAYALSFSAEGDRLAVGSTRSIQILDGSPTRIIKVR
jgi:WD40 repeat protein